MEALRGQVEFGEALLAGLVAGIISATVAIAFAALVFSGELTTLLPTGIGAAMVASVVIGLVVALLSSFPGIVAGVQDSTSVVLGLGAASIATRVTPEAVLPTVFALLATASLLTGAVLYLLGRLRLGGLVRFIPYPVIGGFIAGTGLLLAKGSMQVLTGRPVGSETLGVLGEGDVLLTWIPGAVLGLLLLVWTRRYPAGLWLPAVIVGYLGLFHLVRMTAGVTLTDAAERGWVLGGPGVSLLWEPGLLRRVLDADFAAVLADVGTLGTVALLTLVSVLLYSTGLELLAGTSIDLNQELRAVGIANLGAGFLATFPGFHYFSVTALVVRLTQRRRLAALTSVGVPLAVLIVGGSILAIVPVTMVGGLLLFLGLSFLAEWLLAYRSLPRYDYALVLIILGVIALLGFIQGVAVGMLIAIVLFILSYSRTDVVKHELSGATYRSNVDRDPGQSKILDREGDSLMILALQGFVFFGTASGILERIRRRTSDPDARPLRFVVFDFRLVTGLDSSAVFAFEKIQRLGDDGEFRLVFANLRGEISRQLHHLLAREGVQAFEDRDRAVEWCEEQLLARVPAAETDRRSLEARIRAELPSQAPVDRLVAFLEPLELDAGHRLLTQGERSPGVFFVDRGSVTAYLEDESGSKMRLRTMGPGTVLGEVGTYLDVPASATVVTNEPSLLYHLPAETFRRLGEADPEAAATLHQYVAKVLARRLSQASRTIRSVLG